MLYGERTLSDKEKKKLAKMEKFNAKKEKEEAKSQQQQGQGEVREGEERKRERERERGGERGGETRVRLVTKMSAIPFLPFFFYLPSLSSPFTSSAPVLYVGVYKTEEKDTLYFHSSSLPFPSLHHILFTFFSLSLSLSLPCSPSSSPSSYLSPFTSPSPH